MPAGGLTGTVISIEPVTRKPGRPPKEITMQTIRTRLARLAAASAIAVSLGALAAGPAAAQTGVDIPSRPASVVGTDVDWYHFTLGTNPGGESAMPPSDNPYFSLAAPDVTFGTSDDDLDKVRTPPPGPALAESEDAATTDGGIDTRHGGIDTRHGGIDTRNGGIDTR